MGLGMVVFVCDNGGRGMLYEGGGGDVSMEKGEE